jgi:hypothetical protein
VVGASVGFVAFQMAIEAGRAGIKPQLDDRRIADTACSPPQNMGHSTCLWQRGEQRLVQAFIAQSANEALSKGVLLRLAGRDVVPADLAVLAPRQDRHAGRLGAVVADAQ